MQFKICALASMLLLTGCTAGADFQSSKNAAEHFHQLLNAQQFSAIYDEGTPDFQRATSKDRLSQFLAAVHRKLGDVTQSSAQGTNINFGSAGEIVTLNYASRFERGEASENFAFRLENGTPKLLGYHINSDALVIN
jgi:hypothetical protein